MCNREADFPGHFNYVARCQHICAKCEFGIALAQIRIRHACGMNQCVGCNRLENIPNRSRIGQVRSSARHGNDEVISPNHLHQSTPKQTVSTRNRDFHALTWLLWKTKQQASSYWSVLMVTVDRF